MPCPWCHAENAAGLRTCASCGQSLSALEVGSLIANRYEILQPLGKGGMGMVYKVRDRVLEDIVALKVLRPDVITPEMAMRFRAEIRLARRVTHKNVCRIHEYGEDGPWRYISMAFVEGVDLKRELRQRGSLPPEEAFEVSLGVAEALEAIHEEGIVHRDLKTPNIMKDKKGVVKVMDFGIAKSLEVETGAGMTATGFIVGTPEYMSPEQARGEKVDFRSDLFSLGIVTFELFTGHVPFRADTPIGTLMKVIREPPALGGPEAARLPPAVLPLLQKALQKDPNQRYQSAREMVEALEEARTQSGLSAGRHVARPITPVRTPALRRGQRATTAPGPGAAGSPLAAPDGFEEDLGPTPVPTAVPTSSPTPSSAGVPRASAPGQASGTPPQAAATAAQAPPSSTLARWQRAAIPALVVLIVLPLLLLGAAFGVRRLQKLYWESTLGERRHAFEALKAREEELDRSGPTWTQALRRERVEALHRFLDRFAGDDPFSDEDEAWRAMAQAQLAKWEATVFVSESAGLGRALREAAAGARIHLKRGLYALTEPLAIKRSLVLQGEDEASTTILAQLAGGDQVTHVLRFSGGEFSISHLTLRYAGVQPANLVEVEDGTISLGTCRLQGAKQRKGPAGGGGVGLWLKGTARGMVSGCTVTGNEVFGVYVNGKAKLSIEESRLAGSKQGAGIGFGEEASGEIRRNTAEGNLYGIFVGGSASPTLIGNTTRRNERHGIVFSETARGMLDDHTSEDNGQYGLYIGRNASPSLGTNRLERNGQGDLFHE